MFPIDKGIPMPEKMPTYRKYPWKEMEVGDSFFIPGEHKNFPSIKAAAQNAYGMKFRAVHTKAGVEPEGIRVWRIE